MPDSPIPIDIPIADPVSPASPWWILLLAASLFVIVAVGTTLQRLMPDDPMPLYFMGGAIVFATALPVLLLRLIRRVSIAVIRGNLVVRTGVGCRSVALANLREKSLRVIDLTQHRELDTRSKVWSAIAPELKTGLYRLRNGERAVLVVSDPHRVCYLRSEADALTLLLSLKRPEQLRTLLEK